MHKLTRTLTLVATLVAGTTAGCGKKAATSSGGSCKDAVAAGLKILTPKLTADLAPDKLAAGLKLVGDAQLAACTEDKWPAAAIACMSAAKDNAGMAACAPTMGSANQSLVKVMSKIGPELFSMMKPGKDFRDGDRAGPAAPAAPPTP